MLTTLTLPAPAKLNLFLHITGQRADGYHELQTLFRLVDLCDEIQLTLTDTPGVALSDDSDGPAHHNLAVRAAQMLLETLGDPGGVRIRLRKRIPQGGLGGGSSDAATVLHGLNAMLGARLDVARLAALGLKLGADVPVFVHGHTAWGEGIGDRLTPVLLNVTDRRDSLVEDSLEGCLVDIHNRDDLARLDTHDWYVIVAPGCEVSTAEVFAHPSLTRHSPVITMRDFFLHGARNDCQSLVRRLYPAVDEVIKWLSRWRDARASPGPSDSDQACLSGTGGCVFMRVAGRAQGQALVQQLEQEKLNEQNVPKVWRAWVVQGLDRSPVFAALPPS